MLPDDDPPYPDLTQDGSPQESAGRGESDIIGEVVKTVVSRFVSTFHHGEGS